MCAHACPLWYVHAHAFASRCVTVAMGAHVSTEEKWETGLAAEKKRRVSHANAEAVRAAGMLKRFSGTEPRQRLEAIRSHVNNIVGSQAYKKAEKVGIKSSFRVLVGIELRTLLDDPEGQRLAQFQDALVALLNDINASTDDDYDDVIVEMRRKDLAVIVSILDTVLGDT